MPEFLPRAKVTYEHHGRSYIIDVNEYGGADVSCWEGRGVRWSRKVRPGETLQELALCTAAWLKRINAAIEDLRGLVGADNAQPVEMNVRCSSCGRTASCVQVKDGTVYKPVAWEYPDKANPMQGICSGCQTSLGVDHGTGDGETYR